MQVSDQVRSVVDAIADRVRMATYEASAYRTQRQRFEGGNNNHSENGSYTSDYLPSGHQFYNNNFEQQPQYLLQNLNNNNSGMLMSSSTHDGSMSIPASSSPGRGGGYTSLLSNPPQLSNAQTRVNANRQDIVDYAMKRVASSPASTRVSHDRKTQQQSVYDDLLHQNSQKLTYHMAMQTLKNVQTELDFGQHNNSGLPPRSPPPPAQQQQQLRPTFVEDEQNQQEHDGENEALNGTQKPSTTGTSSKSPIRTRYFTSSTMNNNNNSPPQNYGQMTQQQRASSLGRGNSANGIVMTSMMPSSATSTSRTMSGRDILNQRKADEVLFGKKKSIQQSAVTFSMGGVNNTSSAYKFPTSSSLSRSSYSLNQPRNSKQIFVRTTTTPASPTPNKNVNNVDTNQKQQYIMDTTTDPALLEHEDNQHKVYSTSTSNNLDSSTASQQQQPRAKSTSPESAMGGRTAAPTATSTKISSVTSSNIYAAENEPSSIPNVSALKNHRDVSGFVQYNPEYEQFRSNVQTSLRAASSRGAAIVQ